MITELKQYPVMRDSGLEWMGDIPDHWYVQRAKWLFRKVERPVRERDEVVTCFRDGTVTLRRNRRLAGFTEALKEIGYQGVRNGDLVVHGMDAFAGAIGVSDSDGKCTPVYAICEAEPLADPHYYARLVREMARRQWLVALAKGVRERSTDFRFAAFAAQALPVPPLDEQVAIVRYLDHADRRINRYIRAKQRLVELLEEEKQAIIHQAVTRGLDPDVPLKPSGVDWLGDVPEHWEVLPLKRLSILHNSGSYGSEPEQGECVLPVATTAQIDRTGNFSVERMPRRGFSASEAERYVCHAGDILVVKSSGSIFNVISGKAGIVRPDTPKFSFSNFLLRVVADVRQIEPEYLFLVLSGYLTKERVKRMVSGSTYPNLKVAEYSAAQIPVPPLTEQTAIVSAVSGQTATIDRAAKAAKRQIEVLREYRTRLIGEVVTGKLDVRAAAADLPEVDHADPEGSTEFGDAVAAELEAELEVVAT